MPSAALLTTIRNAWTSRFVDSVTIERITGRGTLNETTKVYDAPTVAAGYSGVALVRRENRPSRVAPAETPSSVSTIRVTLPWNASPVPRTGDRVTVNTSTHDSDLAGRVFWVIDADPDGWNTHRRIHCDELDPRTI